MSEPLDPCLSGQCLTVGERYGSDGHVYPHFESPVSDPPVNERKLALWKFRCSLAVAPSEPRYAYLRWDVEDIHGPQWWVLELPLTPRPPLRRESKALNTPTDIPKHIREWVNEQFAKYGLKHGTLVKH